MVKGVSKQVIVVNSVDKNLFDQAIFILKDGALAEGVTEEQLMKQAQAVVRGHGKKLPLRYYGPVWAMGGAFATAAVWLLTVLL